MSKRIGKEKRINDLEVKKCVLRIRKQSTILNYREEKDDKVH